MDNEAYSQTINQLLVELDGNDNKRILVIAATNRADVLDDALVRKGRFDVHIALSAPDARGREAILRTHARGRALARDVDLARLSATTRGFSGADLAGLMNSAALEAVRRGRQDVSSKELEDALCRATLGIEKRTSCRSAEESEIVAFHEAGHAIVAARLLPPGSVRTVSIVERGVAGGVTVVEPPGDLASLDELERRLAVMMGGRAGEEVRGGRRAVTTGASADIEAATALATSMVERLGLGSDPFPEADDVPRHVRDLMTRALKRARAELPPRVVKRVAQALLQRSTLTGPELYSFAR
jgi:cell division protease FtsH